ncbi:M56 family metallopeptidase [uncultured Draconibacterium sp.]|uniref:M56 family metallopeptidase n=1 Tax=uncultured Draconibacterium sp. TaxID=1573823 RepID=UPI0029C6651E|nr:M56 family metallopeptidase [uncultured Draconibacterium sp.]
MTPFFAYLIKSTISLALLYCLFRLTVRNDKNHRLTRFLLLSVMLVSASIPFLTVQLFYKELEMTSTSIVQEIVSAPVAIPSEDQSAIIHAPVVANIPSVNYWAIIYTAIISLLLFRLLFGIYRVSGIIKKAEKHRFRKIVLAVVKDFVQPFTFLNKVVLSEKDFLENRAIVVVHEYAHIRHKHALDLLLCELFTAVHFFNPFMWLLRRDLKLIHEYQADEAVLNKGIDAQKYQLLVLEKAVGERRFAMANHFTQKPIVKRLKMMTKTKRQKWGMVKMILFVPLIIVLLQAFARPELITKSADFIPVRYTENKAEQWLAKWNIDNIGDGIFDPEMDRNKLSERENNILVILMNIKDEYLVQGEHASKESIKTMATGFLQGVNPGGSTSPESIEKEIPGIGKVKVSEGWISYRHDIESSREAINFTLRQIGEAYLGAREAKAFILFGKKYFDLDVEKQKIVNEIVPIRFSYETPKNPRTSTWLPFEEKPSPEPKPMELLVRYDGTIVFGSKTYENLDEFERDLKVWKKELEAISKEEKTNHYYRVNATFEHGSRTQEICSKEISKINYMLWKQSMHVEQIHHVFPEELNKPGLEMDKLNARVEQKTE